MELSYFISLTFVFALNVLFFVSGICLNSLVILSFWRSVQLRKKLCHFMIMVLSCCDLLVVLTNHPLTAFIAMLWLTGKRNEYSGWLNICSHLVNNSLGFSFFALLVMNFDRYLATHYPLFHRTSVTKRKILTLLAVLNIVQVTLNAMSVNDLVITSQTNALIFIIILFPPMMFFNYKLFTITRKSRRNNGMSPEMKKSFSLKIISSCLLLVACFLVLWIPTLVYSVLGIASNETPMLSDKAKLALLSAKTSLAMNSTINCLIFFWKNKTLRTEGMKLIKGLRISRSQSKQY